MCLHKEGTENRRLKELMLRMPCSALPSELVNRGKAKVKDCFLLVGLWGLLGILVYRVL